MPYCINLLRYCEAEFSCGNKLRQMFRRTFATLETLYEEMGLKYLFSAVKDELDEITPEVCMRLLVRCQTMIRIRRRILDIFGLIDAREQQLKDLNYLVIQSSLDQQEVRQ